MIYTADEFAYEFWAWVSMFHGKRDHARKSAFALQVKESHKKIYETKSLVLDGYYATGAICVF